MIIYVLVGVILVICSHERDVGHALLNCLPSTYLERNRMRSEQQEGMLWLITMDDIS